MLGGALARRGAGLEPRGVPPRAGAGRRRRGRGASGDPGGGHQAGALRERRRGRHLAHPARRRPEARRADAGRAERRRRAGAHRAGQRRAAERAEGLHLPRRGWTMERAGAAPRGRGRGGRGEGLPRQGAAALRGDPDTALDLHGWRRVGGAARAAGLDRPGGRRLRRHAHRPRPDGPRLLLFPQRRPGVDLAPLPAGGAGPGGRRGGGALRALARRHRGGAGARAGLVELRPGAKLAGCCFPTTTPRGGATGRCSGRSAPRPAATGCAGWTTAAWWPSGRRAGST